MRPWSGWDSGSGNKLMPPVAGQGRSFVSRRANHAPAPGMRMARRAFGFFFGAVQVILVLVRHRALRKLDKL